MDSLVTVHCARQVFLDSEFYESIDSVVSLA